MFVSRRCLFAAAAGLVALAAKPLAAGATEAPAIDEGAFVDINGTPQWITIRGRKRDNPVLLILHGGPGFPLSFLAPLYADWEQHFTLVQWDQPSTGGTYLKAQGQATGPLTIERYVRDGVAVAEWTRRRLEADKLVLLGTSWGSVLGVEMAHLRPELFSAYVGVAQAVSPRGAVVGYEMALTAARARGDAAAAAALEKVGPPPYTSFADFMVRQQFANPPGLPPTPQEEKAIGEMIGVMTRPDRTARYNAPLTPPPGYDGGMMAAQQATWQETWAWDARRLGMRFRIPVFIFQGAADVNTPASVAREYYEAIEAPRKAFAVVEGAGHGLILFHTELLALLLEHVRPVVAVGRG